MSETIEAGPISHFHVVLLCVDDEASMDRLLARPELRGLVWKRLDATRALVDPRRIQTLRDRLTSAGVPARLSTRFPATGADHG